MCFNVLKEQICNQNACYPEPRYFFFRKNPNYIVGFICNLLWICRNVEKTSVFLTLCQNVCKYEKSVNNEHPLPSCILVEDL